MNASPINRTSAPNIIRLLDYCFKKGVQEASEFEDDYTAKEWLEEKLSTGGYGLLSEDSVDFDWKRWRFTLYRWCRDRRLNSLAENYIDKIRTYQATFAFAILPITMRFYLMGVQEWLEYPNGLNMALFKQNQKIHWKPMPKHLVKLTTNDYISLIQEFVYERIGMGFEGDMIQSRYDSFAFAMWRCVQKYPVHGFGEEKEDI